MACSHCGDINEVSCQFIALLDQYNNSLQLRQCELTFVRYIAWSFNSWEDLNWHAHVARSLSDSWASCFMSLMIFLSANQQHQSTDGTEQTWKLYGISFSYFTYFTVCWCLFLQNDIVVYWQCFMCCCQFVCQDFSEPSTFQKYIEALLAYTQHSSQVVSLCICTVSQ